MTKPAETVLQTLVPIVRALGGELYDGGRRALVPGPGHSAHDRSVSLLLSGGRLVVYSFGRSSWREVRDDLKTRGLLGDRIQIAEASPIARRLGHGREEARTACAVRLWMEAQPLGRSVAMRHLRRRHVRRAPPVSESLRFHPALASAVYIDRGRRRLALLAAVASAQGGLCAIEVTYLDGSGGRAVDVATPRKIIGLLPPSCAVQLDRPQRALLVGEGVFTTLSAANRFGLPGWALLSTRNLRTWSPPIGVESVLIAADRDEEGRRSAKTLSGRLEAAGLEVRIEEPPAPFGDWNDAALAHA